MTDKELKGIYVVACQAKGFEGNEGQYKMWKKLLGWCERVDLESALEMWFSSNISFPMPAELKPLSEQARRARAAKALGPETYTCWECTDCKTRMGSWNPDWNPTQCRGVRAVKLGHPDYGKACVSRSFRIVGRDVYEKQEKTSAA
jgi:hypothetical protein